MAHVNLYRSEEMYYWLKKVVPKYIVRIHEISFEVVLGPSLDSKVAATIELTFMNVRRKLSAELSLRDIVDMGIGIANKVITALKKLVSSRFTAAVYDRPSNVGDFNVGGMYTHSSLRDN